MNNKNILKRFFEAENSRDWVNYITYLHPNVEWISYNVKDSQTISGLKSYMNKIKLAYEGNEDTFLCETIYSGKAGNRIAAILVNNHGQRSIDIFEFENGLIKKEWEFLLG